MKTSPFFSFIFLIIVSLLWAKLAWAKPLTVCTESNPDGFDVVRYNSLVTTNASADVLFSRLVEFDMETSKILPGLAQRWEVSPDRLSYTFYLRKNVAFHTTHYFKASRTFNADDVIFTFERMINPYHPWHKTSPSGYPHAQSMQLSTLIKSIQKINDDIVVFRLNAPEATFLSRLAMGFASIYSAEYAKQLLAAHKMEQLNTKPIGTGPFIFRSYQKGVAIRFDTHPHYFGMKPKIDKLIYAITPDASVRIQRFKAGECQIALSPKPLDILAARRDSTIQVLETPAFMTAFVAINTQRPPLNHSLVRQAINLSFDKKAYINVVFEGMAIAADQPFPLTMPIGFQGSGKASAPIGHRSNTERSEQRSQADHVIQNKTLKNDGYPLHWNKTLVHYTYDPIKAKKLLVQAGFPNGFDTTIWARATSSTLNPNPRAGAELLQADLAKIGIRAQIKILEWGELIRRAKMGEHDLLFMGWAGDSGDPDDFLTPQFTCAAVQSGTNFSRYCNPQLDHFIIKGLHTIDISSRTDHYLSAQKIIFDQALWLPLAHPIVSVFTQKNLSGYHVSPFGRQNFTTLIRH